MSVTSLTVLEYVGRITIETLEVLIDIMESPQSAYLYCDAIGLPPIGPSAEWAPAVQELRQKGDAATAPEHWAEITELAIKLIAGLKAKFADNLPPGSVTPGFVESISTKVVLPVLLYVLPRFDYLTWMNTTVRFIIYAVLEVSFFADQRLQDDYPQGLFAERWSAILGDLMRKAGWGTPASGDPKDTDPDWAPIVSDSLAVATAIVAGILVLRKTAKPEEFRFWYGFDHPPIPDFPNALELAQRAFTIIFPDVDPPFSPSDYDKPIDAQSPDQQPAPLGFTLVPIPKTLYPEGKSKLYLQVSGQSNINSQLSDDFSLRMTNVATFGMLASNKGIETTGNASFQMELVGEAPVKPADDGKPALTFHYARFGLGARASADDLSAWLRLEKGELTLGGGSWLSDYVPQMRLTFDVTAEASAIDGVRLKGGARGELLIATNQGLGIGSIDSLRIRVLFGDDGGRLSFRVEGTIALTLDLKLLKIHVDGLGAAYQAGPSAAGDGNVAGVAHMGWDDVLPKGAGVEVNFWKIKGGGALFYDSALARLTGAVELHFGDTITLTGLGLYQRAAVGGVRSWLVVVSFVESQTEPGFNLAGGGILYGSNRTTDPQAFLDGLTTGALDALLFPDDVVAKAPQYLAALEKLFPTQKDATVFGGMMRFTALGGAITLDLGALIDLPASLPPRIYLVAQLVALLTAPKEGEKVDPLKLPFRILADGVAIWDPQKDEVTVQILLRNSRLFAGELTGGASIFHGSPQTDGQNRGTYISVGGFHPDYVPPGTRIIVPPRLKMSVGRGDHLKLEVSAYLAYTPSSFQFGLAGQLEAHLYGFGIRGRATFDVLANFGGDFNVHLEFSVELLLGSESIASVMFSGTLTGMIPSVLSGKVEVHFLFWTLSMSGSLTIIDADTLRDIADVAALLAAAIGDAANWSGGGAPGLTLADNKRDGVWLSPTAPLRLAQAVVPLNVQIERFGAATLDAPMTLSIETVSALGQALPTTSVSGEFSLGMFLNLSSEEMLASRGFECRDAGVEIARPLDAGVAVTTPVDFEEIMLDPKSRPVSGPRVPESILVLGIVRVFGTPPAPLPESVRMNRERFSIVDSSLGVKSSGHTFFEARAALKPGLMVLPDVEVMA